VKRLLGLALAGLLVLTGCTTGDDRGGSGARDGIVDAAGDGEPGDIVRSEPIDGAPDGALAWRVLYHSTDIDGADIEVSGVVVAPDTAAPAAGRPIVGWAHPTTGAGRDCAPSETSDPFGSIPGLRAFIAAGYVVAATDYPGMGADGPDSYLIGTNEGNSVLDAARAARRLPGAGANTDLLLWGHSQGGHAALFAAQGAAAYAPELRLAGVAVAAPATDLGALLDAGLGHVSGVTLAAYALDAYSSVYADRGADLAAVLTPAGAEATPRLAALCLSGQESRVAGLAGPLVGRFFDADPRAVPAWATLLAENTPGSQPIAAPVLIVQGDDDELIDPATTRGFADRVCAAGGRVAYAALPGVGHGEVAFVAADRVVAWFGRVIREPVPSGC
jgi:alpha-beta hydrolase superfamily lysophospholipase